MRTVKPTAALLGLLLVFVLGLLPYVDSFFQHHPDERYYTNAAMTMVGTADYLTPRWPDGAPRLVKPVLTYWAAAASYRLLGVSLPASRLPFVLAGALVIAGTYVTTRSLTGRPDVALLAAAITLSAHQLVAASIRTIPDVLLCLFLLASAYGFLRLLVLEQGTPGAYWAAYGGAGLAVATKGLLGVLFVAFAWAFAALDRRGPARPALAALVHVPSMLAGAAVASGWFLVMSAIHGALLWRTFLPDQLTTDARILHGEPLRHIPAHVALLGVNLLPWALAPLELWMTDPRSLRAPDERARRLRRFILLWSLLVAVVFGFTKWEEGRYLLPAGPLGAIVLAGVILQASPAARERVTRHLLALSLACLVALGIVVAAFRAEVSSLPAGAATLAPFLVVAAGLWAGARLGFAASAAAVALATFVAFPLTALSLGPIFGADDGLRAAAAELADVSPDAGRPVLFVGSDSVANRLRILTRGRVPIRASSAAVAPDPSSWPDGMLLPARQAAGLELRGYRTRAVIPNVLEPSPGRLMRAILTGDARALIESRREQYVVAVRRRAPGQSESGIQLP
jgi:4-amino-4-deoxy-L-arabinose transferase-like glycosyltransferase